MMSDHLRNGSTSSGRMTRTCSRTYALTASAFSPLILGNLSNNRCIMPGTSFALLDGGDQLPVTANTQVGDRAAFQPAPARHGRRTPNTQSKRHLPVCQSPRMLNGGLTP